ncbi:hypothetical protein LPJ57_008560, partial [Coemansia sp. RSA 486]
DLGLVSNAAKDSKTPLLLGALAENIYRMISSNPEMAEKDFTSLYLLNMRKFTALYTHQKQKKAKTWQDGFAHFNADSNDLVVFDSSNQRIASYRLRAREKIELSNEYDIGRYLLTLEEEQGDDNGTDNSGDSHTQAPATLLRSAPKRARRLPSLVKPMDTVKHKSASVGAPESISASSVQSKTGSATPAAKATPGAAADYVEYSILYTAQKVKKVKAWADGTMLFYPEDHRTMLKSEDGQVLSSTFLQRSKKIEIGGEMDVGIYLIQIESLKADKDMCSSGGAAEPSKVVHVSKALKRRYEAIQDGGTLRSPLAGAKRNGAALPKLRKNTSNASDTSEVAAITTTSFSASSTANPATPTLKKAQSSSVSSTGSIRSSGSIGSGQLNVSHPASSSGLVPKRAAFAPPVSQVPKYLHFPRRGELLQHVSVGKGYGMGPPRQLIAPVQFGQWKQYTSTFSALLRENLMVELSSLAIRYFFMAREKHQNVSQRADASDGSRGMASFRKKGGFGGKRGFGSSGSLAQICRSVGVMYFEDCTLRQPFLDGKAFRAQAGKGTIQFAKGDS